MTAVDIFPIYREIADFASVVQNWSVIHIIRWDVTSKLQSQTIRFSAQSDHW